MKKTRNTKGTLEALLVIGLILIIPLFFVMRTAAEQNAAQNTPVPIAPTAVNAPALPTAANAPEDNAMKPKQPPACTFPLAQTTTEESMPENYTFSEPQVVLTYEQRQPDIMAWLPDNENVLIMPSQFIDLSLDGAWQTIELFNPETKEIQVFAKRSDISQAPYAWNPKLNAVVYADINILNKNSNSDFKVIRQLKISYGNPDDTQLLADDLPQYGMAVKPDGTEMAYFTTKQLIKLDTSLNVVASIALDRKVLDFKHKDYPNFVEEYSMAWRPNSPQIFLYNYASDNLEYTYIIDSDSGELCALDFGGWALIARWSPNGRYLAIVRAQGPTGPTILIDVVVLDTTTGAFYTLDAAVSDAKDIAWAPDSRHLLFMIRGARSDVTSTNDGLLYLGDFISGQVDRILPAYNFHIYSGTTNLAWSPDGSKLLMNCPTPEGVKQVCLIPVQLSDK